MHIVHNSGQLRITQMGQIRKIVSQATQFVGGLALFNVANGNLLPNLIIDEVDEIFKLFHLARIIFQCVMQFRGNDNLFHGKAPFFSI